VTLDVMISPAANYVSLIRLEVLYDSNKLSAGSLPFAYNTSAFPTVIEGPYISQGRIAMTLSIGPDPTKAITVPTKVGTLTLTAINPTTNGPTAITFGTLTQVLSAGAQDQAAEDVLATASPAYVAIGALPTSTPQPTATPFPTSTPNPTATAFPTNTPMPTPSKLNFTIYLHGIGESGDSTNPTGTSLSNKNPNRRQRTLYVTVVNSSNVETTTKQGFVNYDSSNGNFTGSVDMGTNIPSGAYTIKVKSNSYLRKAAPGFFTIASGTDQTITPLTLVTGDINDDNALNILDYNILLGCYSDLGPASFCDTTRKLASDLTDDGNVNQYDYNLFLREITVQSGN
jgi:hypothetical protein